MDDALPLAERVLAMAGDLDAEVTIHEDEESLLRFAENQPIQHTTARTLGLQLRLRDGERYGESRATAADEATLRQLVRSARDQLDLLPPEPGMLPSVGPQTLAEVHAWQPDGAPEAFDAAARGAAVDALIAPSRAAGLRAAGICSSTASTLAKVTTGGMRGSYRCTSLRWDVTAQADDSTGRASAWARGPAGVDPAALGEQAADVALRGRQPVALEPGAYRVLLSPHAVLGLMGYLTLGFNARMVKEGQTWLAGRLGEAIAGPNITLRQDVAHPMLQLQPFDGDGLAVQPVTMLRNGVASELCYDRRTAAEDGVVPTGWSAGGRNAYGAGAASVVLEGDGCSEDELLAACGDGVYVHRVWYTNWVDPKACTVTGMTRDGLFRIRDGKVAEPLLNMRFNQNLLELFRGVEAFGSLVADEYRVAPALVAGALNLSTGTSF